MPRARGRHVRVPAGGGNGARCGRSQTLSVTFTPTDTADYNDATASVLVTSKGDADDHLGDPAAITYGTALSATQLDATAPVPGTFVYTPAAGTVLGAGCSRRCR